MLHAVIMAGGAGTRFWPASRALRPKQLLAMTGERTMIQATVDRLGSLVAPERLLVLTNEGLVDAVAAQLSDIPRGAILGEPFRRDTAPAIVLAAMLLLRKDDEATMVVMPSDHVISTDKQFQAAIRQAVALVDENPSRLITFGIQPSYPAESFGYIERSEALDSAAAQGAPTFHVCAFREKPDRATAEKYIEQGSFYWNAGIFVWKAKTIVQQLTQHEPAMARHLQQIADAADRPDFDETFRREFEVVEGKSIDYAVMERAEDVVIVEAPFSWDDVGSWQALGRLCEKDRDGNTIDGLHLGIKTQGCIIRGDADHLIATIGIDDLIIVHTPDATLVAERRYEEQVREVVQRLKAEGREGLL